MDPWMCPTQSSAHRGGGAGRALPAAGVSPRTGEVGDEWPEPTEPTEPGRKEVLFLATCFLPWASCVSEHLQEGRRSWFVAWKSKITLGIQRNTAPWNSETQENPSSGFFPTKCENQPISGCFCYSNPTTTLNFRIQLQLQVTSDSEMRQR